MWHRLDEMAGPRKAGEPHGIASVRPADPPAVETAVRLALTSVGSCLVEAVSDPVGRTGDTAPPRGDLVSERPGRPVRVAGAAGGDSFDPAAARDRPSAGLSAADLPLPPASARLPDRYRRIRTGSLALTPRDLVVDHVPDVPREQDRAGRTHEMEYV